MPAPRKSVHPGDRALFEAACALAACDSSIAPEEVEAAERVLHATLADSAWLAEGQPGLVLLVDAIAQGIFTEEDEAGRRIVQRLRTQISDFAARRDLAGATRIRALGGGLAVIVDIIGKENRARGGGADAGETMVHQCLELLPRREARAVFESSLNQAGSPAARLALARGGLACMEVLLPARDETAWQPSPSTVAWLLAGLTARCDGGAAEYISNVACLHLDADQRPASIATPDGTAMEWLWASLAIAATRWSSGQVEDFLAADAAATRAAAAARPTRGRPPAVRPAVEYGRALIGTSLAMRRMTQAMEASVPSKAGKSRRRS